MRGNARLGERVNLTSRRRQQKGYGLVEVPLHVEAELQQFFQFLTQRFYDQQEPRVSATTGNAYVKYARLVLGWLHHERGVPLEELRFKALMPTVDRSSIELPFEFIQFLQHERGCSPNTELTNLRACTQMAKFLFRKESEADPASGDKPYYDVPIIRELRKLHNDAVDRAKVAPGVSKESLKWLDWPEYLGAIKYLKKECALYSANGNRRPDTAVANSIQLYLIFSILACVPDRQRTIRELEVGKTLIQEEGKWIIKHGPGDYKTGKAYGQRPPMVISDHLYSDLEEWISTWREKLSPDHNFLFTARGGRAFESQSLYGAFKRAAYRVTGKRPRSVIIYTLAIALTIA
jgi:hypothetical protein